MRIYWAAPLFTVAEREFNESCAAFLRSLGHVVYLPQECESPGKPGTTYRRNVQELEGSDIVVACLDGPDPDSGTSWEDGYACGKGIPVLAFRTDVRVAEAPGYGRFNLMLLGSATAVVAAYASSAKTNLLSALRDAIVAVAESSRQRVLCT